MENTSRRDHVYSYITFLGVWESGEGFQVGVRRNNLEEQELEGRRGLVSRFDKW